MFLEPSNRSCNLRTGCRPSVSSRRQIGVILWALSALLASIATPSDAGTLKGCVLGRDGNPKAYIMVELMAAGQMRIEETNGNGCFSADVDSGTYVIRIREHRRREEFTVRIRGDSVEKTFTVNW